MRKEDRQHADEIVEWFSREARAKYERGTIEHGGFLPRKGGLLREAEMECLDLPIYVRTIRAQLERVEAHLKANNPDAAFAVVNLLLHGSPADVMAP